MKNMGVIGEIQREENSIGKNYSINVKRFMMKSMKEIDKDEFILRTAEEVGIRAIILYAIVLVSNHYDRISCIQWLQQEHLWNDVSPKEKSFFENQNLTKKDVINIGWRAECLWMILWLTKKISQLDLPNEKIRQQQVDIIKDFLPKVGEQTKGFLANLELQSVDLILHEVEKVYQIHWQIRNAHFHGKPVPIQYNLDVVQERHRILNWVISNEVWDDITTDT